MRIGFLSGDVFELHPFRRGVTVPDYAVQGLLVRELAKRGHTCVLFTRAPRGSEQDLWDDTDWLDCVEYRYDRDVADIDVLFADRIGEHGSLFHNAEIQLKSWDGPTVYHQYIVSSGWFPPLGDHPHFFHGPLTIINRAVDPAKAFLRMTAYREQPIDWSHLYFTRWEPFLMRRWPLHEPVHRGKEQFDLGYYGRLPRGEKRSHRILEYLRAYDGRSVVYGPPTSTAWVSAESPKINDGGKAEHSRLGDYLATFRATVVVPIDRLAGYGNVGYTTHRIPECAIAGVFQLFDADLGLTEFEEWTVSSPEEIELKWGKVIRTPMACTYEARRQLNVLNTRVDPDIVIDRLEGILAEACLETRVAA